MHFSERALADYKVNDSTDDCLPWCPNGNIVPKVYSLLLSMCYYNQP